MFEEEAQRSFDELDDRGVGDDWSIEESYVNGFSIGAEFGYNKAKEIIKDYITIVKGAHTTLCGVPEENRTINVLKLNEEAEQFIREEKNK